MPDIFTQTERSDVMSRIRSGGNKDTELALMRVFRAQRITGWRRHRPVFGKPDFIFPKLRLAVFVDVDLEPRRHEGHKAGKTL